jgi:hypothetical protein
MSQIWINFLHMSAKLPEDAAKSDSKQALIELESAAISYAGKVTAFDILTYVVVAAIGIMGALWLTAYFAPTLFAGIPVLVSFCASMNWIFPLSCAVFFASAGLARIFTIFHERKTEELEALKKKGG